MASSMDSGRGNPAVSGKRKANKPARTDTSPIRTIGKGFQNDAPSSTCRKVDKNYFFSKDLYCCTSIAKIAPNRAIRLQDPTDVDLR